MSQVRQQPLAKEFEATARKQVGEVVRVSEDALSSGAFLYPLRVSLASLFSTSCTKGKVANLVLNRESSTSLPVSSFQAEE
jgi:hypothetical protein